MRPLLVLALAVFSLATAPAATLSVETFTLPIAKVKDLGFDSILLPVKQPASPQQPIEYLPFNAERPLRGSFTSAQVGVIRRALADQAKITPVVSAAPLAENPLVIPTENATPAAALSIGGTELSDGKIETQIQGAPAMVIQQATVSSGDSIILTYAGREPDTVAVYLLQVKGK